MNWITVIWSISAGCMSHAGEMHLLIWVKSRGTGDHLALPLAAVAVAGVAGCEMQLITVGNPADFACIIRWIHVPLLVLVPALVCFPSVAPVTASLACAFLIIRVL